MPSRGRSPAAGADSGDLVADPVLDLGPFNPGIPLIDMWRASSPFHAAYMVRGGRPEDDRCIFSGLLNEALSGAHDAAFEAPDGPLKGSGRLAVHVLICTMRPRAFRSASRNAFMTDKAPNTLTSNSCRMASSGKTSNGPGVRMPALLIRRSKPPPPLRHLR